jgi:hypothetical protein
LKPLASGSCKPFEYGVGMNRTRVLQSTPQRKQK